MRTLVRLCRPRFFGSATSLHSRTFESTVNSNDTIFALATGSGQAGLAVVRVSGPRAFDVFTNMARTHSKGRRFRRIPPARQATLVQIHAIDSVGRKKEEEVLDRDVLALLFESPASFTGEDTVELHVHGSVAVVDAVLRHMASLPEVRQAEAGEFTKRAVLNGKMSPLQAEALGDLLSATTQEQRRHALRQMDGRLAEHVSSWRNTLLSVVADIDTYLDFADEFLQDEESVLEQRNVAPVVVSVRRQIGTVLDSASQGAIVDRGARVALVGACNAGKSSLLNKICQSDVAIVHNEAGTTRDTVHGSVDLSGLKVTMQDTAGLRELPEDHHVEREGMKRSRSQWNDAHVRLAVFDMQHVSAGVTCSETVSLVARALTGSARNKDGSVKPVICVLNKSDLVEPSQWSHCERSLRDSLAAAVADDDTCDIARARALVDSVVVVFSSCHSASSLDDAGVGAVERAVSASLRQFVPESGTNVVLTRRRHADLLNDAYDDLSNSIDCLKREDGAALASEHARRALVALDALACEGRVGHEDILNKIFADFCIGK
ncbi:MAG: hypothetical protein MHM6MM_001846 [Cercozoa sp. M6MM]